MSLARHGPSKDRRVAPREPRAFLDGLELRRHARAIELRLAVAAEPLLEGADDLRAREEVVRGLERLHLGLRVREGGRDLGEACLVGGERARGVGLRERVGA